MVGCGVVVSWLATFRVSVGWRAWACGALTCAYVPDRDGHRPGVLLKVAHCDTARGDPGSSEGSRANLPPELP